MVSVFLVAVKLLLKTFQLKLKNRYLSFLEYGFEIYLYFCGVDACLNIPLFLYSNVCICGWAKRFYFSRSQSQMFFKVFLFFKFVVVLPLTPCVQKLLPNTTLSFTAVSVTATDNATHEIIYGSTAF